MRTFVVLSLVLVAGCASRQSAPISDRPPATRPGTASPAPTVPVPRTERPEFYAARPGDTVRSIAAANGMEPRELIDLNALADPNRLQPGQVLRLRPAVVATVPVAPPKLDTDAGVQVNPIALPSPIETRPIETRPLESRPIETRPPEPVAPDARPPVVAGGNVRAEPRAFKLPYSDENLALVQRGEAPPMVARVDPSPAKPEAAPLKPEAAPAKPEATPQKPEAARGDAEDRVEWTWPAAGRVTERFDGGYKGVGIAGRAGEPVMAAGTGRVIYVGSTIRGYGQLVIIKHNETYLSAYAHNSRILVKEGQSVTRGQKIAEIGQTDADRPKLHFEIRRAGKPVDPLAYLPDRP